MKNKFKVGEYVRYSGRIFKILKISKENESGIFDITCEAYLNEDNDEFCIFKCSNIQCDDPGIFYIKELIHSKNLKELFDVGDYINGLLIIEKRKITNNLLLCDNVLIYSESQIKKFATKELFEEIEIKVH